MKINNNEELISKDASNETLDIILPYIDQACRETESWAEEICAHSNYPLSDAQTVPYPAIGRSSLNFNAIALTSLKQHGHPIKFSETETKQTDRGNNRLIDVRAPRQFEKQYNYFMQQTRSLSRYTANPSLTNIAPDDIYVVELGATPAWQQLDPSLTKYTKNKFVKRLKMTAILSEIVETNKLDSNYYLTHFSDLSKQGFQPFLSDEFSFMVQKAIKEALSTIA